MKDGRSLVECTQIGWIATGEAAEAGKEVFKVYANGRWEITLKKAPGGCAGGIDGSGRNDPSMSGIVVKDVFQRWRKCGGQRGQGVCSEKSILLAELSM